MADSFIILDEPAVTDKKLDAENVDGGSPPLMRERIQVTGAALAEVMRVINSAPAGSEYAAVVRGLLFPNTSGGCTGKHVVAAASTNAQNVKASAGQLYAVRVFNNAAYPVYVKFHNTAGTPTAGSGVVYTVGVQAGVCRDVVLPFGLPFATGIGLTIVKDLADAGATAVAASDCVVDVEYK